MSGFYHEGEIPLCQPLCFPMQERKRYSLSYFIINYLMTFSDGSKTHFWENYWRVVWVSVSRDVACWCRVNMAQVYMSGDPWSCAVHNLRTTALLFHYSDFSATLSLTCEISLNSYLHGFPVIPFFSLKYYISI